MITGDEMHNSGAQLKFPSDLLKTAMFRWHITLSILTPELHTATTTTTTTLLQKQHTMPIWAAVPVAPNKCILVYPSGSYGRVAASSHRTPIIIRICQLELYILFIEGLNTKFNRI